jgi:hypothetical protein
VLIECVLGAVGLAIEQAAFDVASSDQSEQLRNKTEHLKQVLRDRLTSLIKRRRRIEALKARLQKGPTPVKTEFLRAKLAQREHTYQERLLTLQRGRQKLARWQAQLAAVEA